MFRVGLWLVAGWLVLGVGVPGCRGASSGGGGGGGTVGARAGGGVATRNTGPYIYIYIYGAVSLVPPPHGMVPQAPPPGPRAPNYATGTPAPMFGSVAT